MSSVFPIPCRRHIEKVMYGAFYETRAAYIQNDIDVILSESSRRIVKLPGENDDAEELFWGYCARRNDYFYKILELELACFIASAMELKKIKPRSRQKQFCSIAAYLEENISTSLRDMKKIEMFRRSDKNYFLTFASKEDISRFEQNQAKLLIELLKDIDDRRVYSVRLGEIAEKYGLENSQRLSAYIDKSSTNLNPSSDQRSSKRDKLSGLVERYSHLLASIQHTLSFEDEPFCVGKEGMERLVAELNKISGDPFKKIAEVTKAYELQKDQVVRFIFSNPARFINGGVAAVTDLPGYIKDSLKKEWVLASADMRADISRRLYDDHNIDIRPSNLAPIIRMAIGGERVGDIADLFKLKRELEPLLAKQQPIDPERIRVVNNIQRTVGEIFSIETIRPRKKKQEQGGRAGWGTTKPDLWKPDP